MNLLLKHKITTTVYSILMTIIILIALVFVLNKLSPVDPVLSQVGEKVSEETYKRVHQELGLDKPIYLQLITYLKNILTFDLGVSAQTNNPVLTDIKTAFPATIELATCAIIISIIIGIPLGVLSAYYQNTVFDHVVRVITLVGSSMSVFWLGMIALVIFYAKSGWSFGPGRLSNELLQQYSASGFILVPALLQRNFTLLFNAVQHIWLPAVVLAFINIAYMSRMTRSYILEQMQQEYVLACRAKGVSEVKILFKHCLPNIKIPMTTMLLISYANLLEGSTLTETIYMWPGIGYYMTKSLLNNDTNSILGCTIVLGIIFILTNFLVEKINERQKL